MWLAHSFARLSRSAIASIGKSLFFCVGGSVNIPRLNCSHVGRSIGWMFSHARFSAFLSSISLMSVSSIQIFFVKSSLKTVFCWLKSQLPCGWIHSWHQPPFRFFSFSLSITFNMRILNHRSARKSRVNFTFFLLYLNFHFALVCGFFNRPASNKALACDLHNICIMQCILRQHVCNLIEVIFPTLG